MNFGLGEMGVLILIAVLLFFGPSQLPKMARGLGGALREFKKAQREITDEITREEPEEKKASDKAAEKSPHSKPID
jgi:sec-independent protein translocase protein TatA